MHTRARTTLTTMTKCSHLLVASSWTKPLWLARPAQVLALSGHGWPIIWWVQNRIAQPFEKTTLLVLRSWRTNLQLSSGTSTAASLSTCTPIQKYGIVFFEGPLNNWESGGV